jgi:tetratricopeptide (TPR) repeat protein/CHAT domain-containing protein
MGVRLIMKIAGKDDGSVAKFRLKLSSGSFILLMGLGCLAGIGGTTIAQPLRVSQQPAAENATASAAQAAFDEGFKLFEAGTAESLRQAIEKFQEAAPLFAAVGDRQSQATCFLGIGRIYANLGEKQKALEYYAQALPLSKAVGDRAGEATTLTNIGNVYSSLGEKQKALEYYAQALPLSKAVRDRAGEATTLTSIGLVYSALGEKQKALEYYAQALPLSKAVGDRAGESTMLNNIGGVYADLGETQKALEYYAQSLPLSKAVGDRAGEAATLTNIGSIYFALGETQKALDYFAQALPLSKAVGDRALEATTLSNIGSVYSALGEKQKALEYYVQSLPLSKAVGDRALEATTLSNIGSVYSDLGEKQKALDYYAQALSLRKTVGDRAGEATTLNNIGGVYSALGEKQKALDYYAQALTLWKAVGDRAGKGATLNNIGSIYSDLGEKQKALDYYAQALPLRKAVGDRAGEATTLSNIGGVYSDLGEKQKALDYYAQALPLRKAVGDRAGEATTLNNIGRVYDALGETQKALDYYAQALPLRKAVGDRAGEATTISNIGSVYSALGENQKALDYYAQSLSLNKAVGDRAGEATTLNNIGRVYSVLGETQKALDYFAQSLSLNKAVGDRAGEATTISNIGLVYDDLGEKQKALGYYAQSLPLMKVVGDRSGEATTLNNIANVYRDQGKLEEALKQINLAIAIVEDLRTKIDSQDLRASYFATVQDYYQLKTDLLMELHQKFPEKGYEKQALETADRSRARGLIELLTEAGVTLQSTTESTPVITQERQLQQSLRQIEQQRVVLLSGEHTPTQIEALDKKSDLLVAQLQDLTTRLRATSPAYANLKYPQPLTTNQIQQQVVDPDTVLLQYALGEKQSYLWAVTSNGIKSYTLPSRTAIETAAKPFQSVISTSGNAVSDAKRTGDTLYKLILSPAAEQLQGKRLLIVADGILQTIPFAALPLPNAPEYTPLLKDHEIINAPSASSVAIQRQQQYPIGTKTVAVIADPVFKADDGRVTGKDSPTLDTCSPAPSNSKGTGTLAQTLPVDLQRNLRDLDLRSIQRLPNTQLEAAQILALVPPGQRSAACAFSANYERITQPQQTPLSQYRIVHFATHGFINNERPQFSGLVLSLVNSKGKPRDGFLRLRDIFNLKLAADLVVLSACQTGLGKDIRGEGIVGLTRGFMYAGSKRVVTSLWNVDDAATAKLMGNFYSGMLKDKQTPAVALRNAQLQMWKTNPNPRLWAAFTLQGEWRP